MKIVVVYIPHRTPTDKVRACAIHAVCAFNDEAVTQVVISRIESAARVMGMGVYIGYPDWPDVKSFVEDLEQDAQEWIEEGN